MKSAKVCFVGYFVLIMSFFISGCTDYMKVGEAEYGKGNYQAAIENFNKAIQKNPNNDEAYDDLAHVYRDFEAAPNHRDFAYSYANKAIEVCSEGSTFNLAVHYMTLADLYRQDDNYAEANNNFKRSLELNPDDYQTQFFYGVSLYASGNQEAGINHIKKSLKINPDYQNAKNLLNKLRNY
jgi:tetratricopeptide (TPR) repeat protein